jgi:hypothetical protein
MIRDASGSFCGTCQYLRRRRSLFIMAFPTSMSRLLPPLRKLPSTYGFNGLQTVSERQCTLRPSFTSKICTGTVARSMVTVRPSPIELRIIPSSGSCLGLSAQKRFFGHISPYDDELRSRIEQRNLALGSAAKKMSSPKDDPVPVAGKGKGNTSSSKVQTKSLTGKPRKSSKEEHGQGKLDDVMLTTEEKAAFTLYILFFGSIIGTTIWGVITNDWAPLKFVAAVFSRPRWH